MCSEYIRLVIALCCAIIVLIWCVIFQYKEIEKLQDRSDMYEKWYLGECKRNESLKGVLQGVKDLMPF